jgi:two-component sensor histidine kinase
MTHSTIREAGRPQSYEELLRRLEEAEDTIQAIREGKVDAFVVRPVQDEQIFTLQGEKASYRAFMETMGHGAAALGANGEILYANSILTSLIGKPLSKLQGLPLADQFGSATAAQIRSLLAAAEASNDAASSCQITFKVPDEDHFYLASAEPLQIGVVNGWAVTLTDLTDRVRAEESVAAERAARAIIASANEAVVVCDVAGKITHANAAVKAITEHEIIGLPFHEAIKVTFSDAIGLVQTEEVVRMAISGNPVQGLEAHAAMAPRAKDLLVSAAPLSSADGSISGCVIAMVDLSQRKAAEKQQDLLMAELNHRVKNTLTLVLSILGRTREESIDAFKKSFSARVHALAATHDLLSNNSWNGLSVGELATAELAPYVQDSPDRVKLKGARLMLKPRAAVAMGLILHELAANAAKYGSLSQESGEVSLAIMSQPGEATILEWREYGGPPVTEPAQSGFGTTVITRSLSYSSDGGAELKFEPAGVQCLIRIPPEDID